MLATNIKNLPEGEYMTEHGYSQSYPWKVIARTPATATLARVHVERDPEWQPEFHPGGFAAHCSNQSDQTWLFGRLDEADTITVRKTKYGWRRKGVGFTEQMARHFYDYNF
ncbi:MAG: hypothetical protein KDJ69_12205 [Nitratireductor sp.]|nr:hypothetical protein [Nitratireductor sp.]